MLSCHRGGSIREVGVENQRDRGPDGANERTVVCQPGRRPQEAADNNCANMRMSSTAKAESTRNQDTTTASCAAEERFRDLRAFAGRRDPPRMPVARPIALLTHSAAS